jgi:hypothetical protein
MYQKSLQAWNLDPDYAIVVLPNRYNASYVSKQIELREAIDTQSQPSEGSIYTRILEVYDRL